MGYIYDNFVFQGKFEHIKIKGDIWNSFKKIKDKNFLISIRNH